MLMQFFAAAAILMITVITFFVMVKALNDDDLRIGVVFGLIVTVISFSWLFTAPFKYSTAVSVVFAILPMMVIMTYRRVRTVMNSGPNRIN